MTAFLPEDYEAPSSSGNYMKLQAGENKIRILSVPVLGWEDWTLDKKPVRFAYDKKPAKSIDPARAVRHFWAMIVWNYREEKIQILQLSQSSIRASIQALSENEDWGAPFFYDIKITKKGEKVDTEYNVAPSPHKPVSDAIKKAFADKPCNVEALILGTDPFADIANGITAGVFDEESTAQVPKEPTLTSAQQAEIISLSNDDDELQARILEKYKVISLDQILSRDFDVIKSHLIKRKAGVK